jgi:lysosomal alpha-mannosidase
MSVLNDRTQGGSSLTEGTVELMVHRRLTKDGSGGSFHIDELGIDGKGLVVRGKHLLFFNTISDSAKLYRDFSQRIFMGPIVSFAKYTSTEAEFRTKHVTSFSGVEKALPENVNLLTLENWKKNQLLIRLEHFYESSDNNDLSKAVTVDLQTLFKTFKITNIVETTLAANEILSESERLHWNTNVWFNEESQRSRRAVDSNIELTPQQIRTFILTVDNNLQPLGMNKIQYF